MNIHFVCRGNVFRSRMAEAYARSKIGKHIKVSSSGIEAQIYPEDYLSSYAQIPLEEAGLTKYASSKRVQTSQLLLNKANVIIFVDPSVEKDTRAKFKVPLKAYVRTWNIDDIDGHDLGQPTNDEKIALGKETYSKIRKGVDKLLRDVKITLIVVCLGICFWVADAGATAYLHAKDNCPLQSCTGIRVESISR